MLDLLDYRRRTFEMYRQIRKLGTSSTQAFTVFKKTRDDLFANHSQSALDDEQKKSFQGLGYYDYNPAYRVLAQLIPDEIQQEYTIDTGDDDTVTTRQIGTIEFKLPNGSGSLAVFWIRAYGGGIFIPFRDKTNQKTSYGGGRYLYDTIKGADLGTEGEDLLLDFNYAYHPSCYYNPRWTCPLAPMQNRLSFAIEAGEQLLP
jgi:uncharacterized protein